MHRWLVFVALLVTGCASSADTGVAPFEPEAGESEVPPAPVLDREPLERAEKALDEGDRRRAAVITDSLWEAWGEDVGLDPGAAEDLVDLLVSNGAEDRAASILLRLPEDLDGGQRKRLRDLASRLSIRELEELLQVGSGNESASSIVTTELAWALARAGRSESAGRLADAVLAGDPDDEERSTAERVLKGEARPPEEPIRIGVVLPASGRFAAVGEQILEGALLALELHRADPDHAPIDLVVLDDSSRVDLGVEHVETLEEDHVAAVLGPVRTEALESAAARRERDDLLLLSPTASGGQGEALNAYTLWDRGRREVDVALALASWLSESMGIDSLGVLYPFGWSPQGLEALRSTFTEYGGRLLVAEPYVADSTTFGTPITAVAAAEPEAVIVFSDGPRTVLQIAPQLVYYGLRRWVTAGDANWSDPAVVRRLDPSYADHRLVGMYVDRVSPDTPWQEFEEQYEAKYRKAMADNMFTALGYDAMSLILAAVPEAEWERRGAIGRSLRTRTHEGATGSLTVDGATGTLGREVFVRMLQDGDLVVPDAAEMLVWAESQRELEDFLRELEEDKENEESDP